MNKQNSSADPVTIFYSYAHSDERLRDELERHLTSLLRQGLIATWYDRRIIAGTDWAHTIDTHLNESSLILLLISPGFITSNYCYGIEMQRALERHEANEARVIPILLRPVHWKGTPIEKLQMLPTNAKPITGWRNRDKAFADVVKGIHAAIKDLQNLAVPTPASTFPRIWNIPYPRNPFFTGREDVLADLVASLKTNQTAALAQPQAISGLGGIGKTQIAVEYAYRYRSDYQIVLWARAETREVLLSSFVTCAQLLNLPEKISPDQAIIVNAFIQWMRAHTMWLLILDNSDNLEMVKEFLPTAFGGHIILTTRAQAMGRLAQRIEVVTMTPETGALFLLRRATLIAVDTSLDQASINVREDALKVVWELGGLPLALDQAGAYLEETGINLLDYLNLYRKQKSSLLSQRGGLVSDHPEPVTTTWSISFEQLEQVDPTAANLLRFCAFLYSEMIPEEIITKGLTTIEPSVYFPVKNPLTFNEALKALYTYSFVKRDVTNHTFSMHRLVQVILKDEMDIEMHSQWAQRAILAIHAIFPDIKFTTWPLCERYLSNAQVCALLIEQGNMLIPEAAHLLYKIGRYLHARGRYTEAEPPLQRALAIRKQILGMQHPDTATSLNLLGNLYYSQGKYADAEALYMQTRAIRERLLGTDHPDTASIFHNLGTLYYAQGKYAEAEQLLQQALSIREQLLGSEHSATTRTLSNLGRLYYKLRQYADAEALFMRIRVVRERLLGSDHPDTASVLHHLGTLYYVQGKYREAEPLLQQALSIQERLLGSEHPDRATSLASLAQLYDLDGKDAEAETLYLQALTIQKQRLGFEHPDTINTLKNYILLLRRMHRMKEAELLEAGIPPGQSS